MSKTITVPPNLRLDRDKEYTIILDDDFDLHEYKHPDYPPERTKWSRPSIVFFKGQPIPIIMTKVKRVATPYKMPVRNILMNILDGSAVIGHVNGDTLDCRRENLKIDSTGRTKDQKVKPRNTTSKNLGVSWNLAKKKWKVQLWHLGVLHFLGYFDYLDELKALRAYEHARIALGFELREIIRRRGRPPKTNKTAVKPFETFTKEEQKGIKAIKEYRNEQRWIWIQEQRAERFFEKYDIDQPLPNGLFARRKV